MKKIMLIISLFLIPVLFLGCVNREPKIVYLTKIKTNYLYLPTKYYLDDIEIPKPVDIKTYIKANPLERERYNVILILKLYKTIGDYKIKLKTIKDYETKIRKIK